MRFYAKLLGMVALTCALNWMLQHRDRSDDYWFYVNGRLIAVADARSAAQLQQRAERGIRLENPSEVSGREGDADADETSSSPLSVVTASIP